MKKKLSKNDLAGFSPERFEKNPNEKAMAEEWVKDNLLYNTFDAIIDVIEDEHGTLNKKEYKLAKSIANMMMQWVGTPCGQRLVARAAEKCAKEGEPCATWREAIRYSEKKKKSIYGWFSK